MILVISEGKGENIFGETAISIFRARNGIVIYEPIFLTIPYSTANPN